MKKSKKTDKSARKTVHVSLPGRPGAKLLPAAEAVAFARQLNQQQQWAASAVLMQQVTQQVPALGEAWMIWFEACHGLGDFTTMARVATRCLNAKPRYVPALVALATAMRMNQRHDEALALIEKARKLEPGNASLLNHLGIVQKEMGATEAALDSFNRCLTIKPDLCEAWWNRSDLQREPDASSVSKMENLLQKPGLSPVNQARLHYALSRAAEQRGDVEQQFHHVEAGARLKRSTLRYDHQAEMQRIAHISQYFTAERLNLPTRMPERNATPIFICGLPRSGTTLVEQILSSHPQVCAGDELTALPLACAQQLKERNLNKAFPQWAEDFTAEDWLRVGERYLDATSDLHGCPFFTDKNLQNYQAIGLIHLALPDARIIFCRRDPMDTLWSCYRQWFADGLMFTYDQTELADIWNAADELLAWWQRQLGDKLLVLDYEALLDNQKQVTEQLLAYVGLPWEEQCLHFYQNHRAVRTTSSVQVRQPLHPARRGQWLPFADKLMPMQQRLRTGKATGSEGESH